jgi:AcrR family transcriptional regulator
MPRAALREDQIQDFRHRLISVASTLFVEHGYSGVTFRALAEGLGCSPTTPYRYFENKDEIFAAVRTTAYEHFAATLEAAALPALDPLERLREIGRAYVRFGIEYPDAYQLMFALRQNQPDDYPELRAAELQAWTPLSASVQAAIDSGDISGDGDEVAHLCWAGAHGIVSLHLAGKLVLSSVTALAEPMLQSILESNRPSMRTKEKQ